MDTFRWIGYVNISIIKHFSVVFSLSFSKGQAILQIIFLENNMNIGLSALLGQTNKQKYSSKKTWI